ncbi:MAG: serine--tRNA ligase [Calditrichia bacterium]|nr:serine--tRNA ligase [Calditrichia bacterium]
MLDIKFIRDNTELVKKGVLLKGEKCDVDRLLELDSQRRQFIYDVEQLKKERNENSKKVADLKKEKKDATDLIERTKQISSEIKDLDEKLGELQIEIKYEMDRIPNMPNPSTPEGKDSEDNVEVKTWGEIPKFDFEVMDHLALGERLDILDFKRGGKVAGSGFPVYKGMGAGLERALINFMLDLHIREHGYTEIFPPFLANRISMYGTGQLPKLEEDMYLADKDDLFLIPTAEVPLTNLHRDEILPAEKIPLKYVAYSACFRREAGSYGKETRGFLRVHQFNKVELVNFTLPEDSYEAHERILKEATKILELLEIPYRVLVLSTGDLSFAAAKCYDIETWSPAENKWLEASSVSNFEDFQARRANIRFKRNREKSPEFVHTLNGSGLATSRLMVSLMEINQTDEGTIVIPNVLQPYLGGLACIKRAN